MCVGGEGDGDRERARERKEERGFLSFEYFYLEKQYMLLQMRKQLLVGPQGQCLQGA